MNGVPITENFDNKRSLMLKDMRFVPIEGANHAQFGDYGPQKGDVVARLSLTEQHGRVAEIMLDFITLNRSIKPFLSQAVTTIN